MGKVKNEKVSIGFDMVSFDLKSLSTSVLNKAINFAQD